MKIISVTINDLIVHVSTSMGHHQDTERSTVFYVVYLLIRITVVCLWYGV